MPHYTPVSVAEAKSAKLHWSGNGSRNAHTSATDARLPDGQWFGTIQSPNEFGDNTSRGSPNRLLLQGGMDHSRGRGPARCRHFDWVSPLSFDWLRMMVRQAHHERLGRFVGGRTFASLSAYGRGARNYFTYFFVYSARCSDAPARGLRQSRGHQWGEAVYSYVFERRLPPGPVAILVTDGVGRRCFGPASLMSGCKHVFHLDDSRIDELAEYGQRRRVSVFEIGKSEFCGSR